MAEASGAGPGVGALEIGPGIGVLTAELAKRADRVVSLEIDQRLLPILQETLARFEQVKILNSDVLKTDLHRLIAEEFAGLEVVVCANLPYYITSPVIMKLLEENLPVKAVTVMVQKEAAQRLCALPAPVRAEPSAPPFVFTRSRKFSSPSPAAASGPRRTSILLLFACKSEKSRRWRSSAEKNFSQPLRRPLANGAKPFLNALTSLLALPATGLHRPARLPASTPLARGAAVVAGFCRFVKRPVPR